MDSQWLDSPYYSELTDIGEAPRVPVTFDPFVKNTTVLNPQQNSITTYQFPDSGNAFGVNTTQYQFTVKETSTLINFANSYIEMQCRITDSSGAAYAGATAAFGCIDPLGVFDGVYLSINNQAIEDTQTNFAICSYMKRLTNYTHDDIAPLAEEGFYMDTSIMGATGDSSSLTSYNLDAQGAIKLAGNDAVARRYIRASTQVDGSNFTSRAMTFKIPLSSMFEFFRRRTTIMKCPPMVIRLLLNQKYSFPVINTTTTTTARITIDQLRLFFNVVTPPTDIFAKVMAGYAENKALITSYENWYAQSFSATGTSSNINLLFTAAHPRLKKLCILLMDSTAFNGSDNSFPFYFPSSIDYTNLSIQINGIPLQLANFDLKSASSATAKSANVIQLYETYRQACGLQFTNASPLLDFDTFCSGICPIIIDVSSFNFSQNSSALSTINISLTRSSTTSLIPIVAYTCVCTAALNGTSSAVVTYN